MDEKEEGIIGKQGDLLLFFLLEINSGNLLFLRTSNEIRGNGYESH